MPEEKKTGFSGIFSGLKKMVFTEDYLDAGKPEEIKPVPAQQSFKNTPTSFTPNNSGIITTNVASEDMVQKIYSLLESMNKPGIDFFELWNAAEAMGGVNVTNLQNAFTTLKVLGLDKNTVLNTGEAYCADLQSKLNTDIQKKRDEREAMTVTLQNEKQQLQREKQDLENKIQLLSTQLTEATTKLNHADSKYAPQIQSIEGKIQSGVNALNVVVAEIKGVLETVKANIN
jgi:Skp family chaperone for outer membrane proteins